MKRLFFAAIVAVGALGCGEDASPTATVTVSNQFPATAFTLTRVVYNGVDFGRVAPGATSPARQAPVGNAYAYALGVFGARNDGSDPPPLVLRLRDRSETTSGGTFTLVWSFPSHYGKCGGMSQTEYEQIARDVFPGVAVQPYAQISCPAMP